MKKLMLTLVFIFVMGSFTTSSANKHIENNIILSNSLEIVVDCFDVAIDVLEWLDPGYNLSDESATTVLNELYAWCEAL